MANRLNIPANWDAIVIGDGSGQRWDIGAGWASVLIDRATRRRKLFYGGMNSGTVYIAEIMPYLHAMQWYSAYLESQGGHVARVHCITDNEAVATQGHLLRTGVIPTHVKKQRALWVALASFAQQGILLDFTFVPRSEIALNVYVDDVSRQSRLMLADLQLPCVTDNTDGSKTLKTVNIYDVHCDNFESLGKPTPTQRQKL